MADQPPEIPGYKIISTLGKGGMATVYLAIQERLNRKVAIKILEPSLFKSEDEEVVKRFEREAQTIASMSHSNIAQIFDINRAGKYYYITMEYLEESLRDWMRRSPGGKIHLELALDIVEDIMKALDYAHLQGIYHRDIKPDNIMFRKDSTPVLVDFGLAQLFEFVGELTTIGTTLGSAYYMSPEQARTQKKIDGRSDVYSLGVVLYEMLTGKRPYKGDDQIEIALQHIKAPVPKLPDELSRYQPLIDSMMAKDIESRISSGVQVTRIIDRILTSPVGTVPLTAESPQDLHTESTLPEKMAQPYHPEQTSPPDLTAKNLRFDECWNSIKTIANRFVPYINHFLSFLKKNKNRLSSSLKKEFASFSEAPLKKKAILSALTIVCASLIVLAIILIAPNQPKEKEAPASLLAEARDAIKQVSANIKKLSSSTLKVIIDGYYQEKLKLAEQYIMGGDMEGLKAILEELKRIKYTQEIKEMEEIIDRPEDLEFYKYLYNARLHYNQKDFSKARDYISKAQQINSTQEVLALSGEIEKEYTKETNNSKQMEERIAEQKRGDEKNLKKLSTEPYSIDTAADTLRSSYKSLHEDEIEERIKYLNFFDKKRNENGEFNGHYKITGQGNEKVIIENRTALMWYDGRLSGNMRFKEAEQWLDNLNKNKYGGYDDWRFPTVEEAASLLKKEKNRDGLHISPVFSSHQPTIWTRDGYQRSRTKLWIVSFDSGSIEPASRKKEHQVRPVRSLK